MSVLIWGGNGWIGSMLRKLLKDYKIICASSRMEDRPSVILELDEIKPDFVIITAGLIGKPNVDWCEDHKQDTILINVIGTINVVDACYRRNIHVTNYASGCIYTYDTIHAKFDEEAVPNFKGSTYSISKIYAQELQSFYNNVLILRLRMPISDELEPKNFITKITKYAKVINVPNSVTVLSELLPISIKMMEAKLTGIYNLVNPGVISHNEILRLYKKYVDPTFIWENFSVEEQNTILKAQRSNCELDTKKLEAFHKVTPVTEAVERVIKGYKLNSN